MGRFHNIENPKIMRQLKGFCNRLVTFLAIGLAVFHLWTGLFGTLPAQEQRAVHVGLALILVFASHLAQKVSADKGHIPWWDFLLIALVLMSAGNIFVNWMEYMPIMVRPVNHFELFLAITGIIAVLEAGRRSIGWIFPLLTALMIAYACWGQFIPGEFGHAPIRWEMILTQIYFSSGAMWGFLTGISATYVALFIIFGAILLHTGGGKTFIDLAILLTGKYRGGPAKVAVLGSGFFAMLSGSSMVNVATTGSLTIPMMKKLGYRSEFAAGVESAASTGGIVTPPIMGAAAFIMAEFLGIPYLKVCIAAAIPAFLFYVSMFMGVHFEAVKNNLSPIPREELPMKRDVFTMPRILSISLPVATLLYMLLAGYSLTLVATSACLMALMVYILSNPPLGAIRERLCNVPRILEAGGKTILTIVPVLVCANILIDLLIYTGLGLKISNSIIELGQSHILLSLFATAGLVMILGTGLTVTAAYILGVVVAVPLLIGWGILPIAAHLFILYYSILGTLTPPICPTVYVGAHIAQANWLKTAWVALRLAPLLYLVPFLVVFDSTFIFVGAPLAILLNVSTAVIGAIILVSGTMKQLLTKCRIYESVVLVTAGFLLLTPGWQTDLLGVGLVSAILVKQLWQMGKLSLRIQK